MSEVNGTAQKLHPVKGKRGDMAVYRLTPPYREQHRNWSDDTTSVRVHEFVAVSAVDLDFGGRVIPDYRTSETMIFPSDGDDVTDFGELAMVDHKSHADALAELGYVVAS